MSSSIVELCGEKVDLENDFNIVTMSLFQDKGVEDNCPLIFIRSEVKGTLLYLIGVKDGKSRAIDQWILNLLFYLFTFKHPEGFIVMVGNADSLHWMKKEETMELIRNCGCIKCQISRLIEAYARR